MFYRYTFHKAIYFMERVHYNAAKVTQHKSGGRHSLARRDGHPYVYSLIGVLFHKYFCGFRALLLYVEAGSKFCILIPDIYTVEIVERFRQTFTILGIHVPDA